ncbi:MAG: TonB family protein [bacterium]
MMPLLWFLLKSSMLLIAGLLMCRLRHLGAADRHLVLFIALVSLPLVVLIERLPGQSFTFSTPAEVSQWEMAFTTPHLSFDYTLSSQSLLTETGLREAALVVYGLVTFALLLLWLLRVLNTKRWLGPTQIVSTCFSSAGVHIPVRQTSRNSSPMTWGIVRPEILVPAAWSSWSAEKQESALLHELAHINRHDTLLFNVCALICCFFWFHPLVWLTQRRLKVEAERACDDAVIVSGKTDTAYAEHLIEIARGERVGAALAMASPSMLSIRIAAILDNTLHRHPMKTKRLIPMLLLAVAIVLPVGAMDLAENEAAPALASDADLLPIVKVGAVYPQEAKDKGIEGYVLVEFTVNATGLTEGAKVVRAEPPGVFEEEALKAVARYRYKPRVVAGQGVAVEGIRNRLTFRLDGGAAVENGSTERAPGLSDRVYEQIAATQAHIDNQEYAAAAQILSSMKAEVAAMNANELGQVHNLAGFLAFNMNDYPKAIAEYEQIIAQADTVAAGLRSATLFTLAQLNFATKDFEASLRHIRQWMQEAENPGPIPQIFMAQTLYQMQDYPAAIDHMELGLAMAQAANMETRENWWALLSYLYFEEEQWDQVVRTLQVLNDYYPSTAYQRRLQNAQKILADEAL